MNRGRGKNYTKFNVTVDASKCKNPSSCAICIAVCPHSVFFARPVSGGMMGRRTSVSYMIIAYQKDYCDGCMRCAEGCPEGSIEVKPEYIFSPHSSSQA